MFYFQGSVEDKMASFKGDDRAADGIPVEVRLDNGGYFEVSFNYLLLLYLKVFINL